MSTLFAIANMSFTVVDIKSITSQKQLFCNYFKKSCQSLEKIDLHRKMKNGAKLIKFKIDNYYFL